MHDLVIGLFINRYEFGLSSDMRINSSETPSVLCHVNRSNPWQQGRRNAMTLHKGPGLQVVLIAMHANTTIPSHRADGPISVQVLEGRLTFRTEAHAVPLSPGQVLTLHAGMPHAVEAIEESAFL